MSLDQLRDLRRGGHRPADVTVIIGTPHKSFEEGPDKVVINRADQDLSPLVGLLVHVIDLQDSAAVTLRTIAALESFKVQPIGICGPAGSCGVSPEHEYAMESYRRALCLTA